MKDLFGVIVPEDQWKTFFGQNSNSLDLEQDLY